jgi:hypothetical protein
MPLLLPGELGNVLSFDPLLSLVSGSPVGCGCRNSDGWFKKKFGWLQFVEEKRAEEVGAA